MTAQPGLVIFDMDGTLTESSIDFELIRSEIGLESGTILEAMEVMPPAERQRANEILEAHERVAAGKAELREGVHEVLSHIKGRGIRTAIATRNSRASLRTVLDRHGVAVDRTFTREDGPVKPSPQPILSLCADLRVLPGRSWMVGDYLYDIQSGNAAGATTLLLAPEAPPAPEYADQADYVIRDLRDIIEILENGDGHETQA